MSIKINTIPCNIGSMDNYAYIITDLDTNICAIVDAAEEKTLVNFCSNHNIVPQYVLSTHHHEDHTNANLALKKLYNLQIIGSASLRLALLIIVFSCCQHLSNIPVCIWDKILGSSLVKYLLVSLSAFCIYKKDSVSIRFRPHKILLFFAFPLHLLSYFR